MIRQASYGIKKDSLRDLMGFLKDLLPSLQDLAGILKDLIRSLEVSSNILRN